MTHDMVNKVIIKVIIISTVVVQQYDWGALENISVCEESYAPHDRP